MLIECRQEVDYSIPVYPDNEIYKTQSYSYIEALPDIAQGLACMTTAQYFLMAHALALLRFARIREHRHCCLSHE